MSEFTVPAPPSAGFDFDGNKGALLLIKPISKETDIQTSFGPKDAVSADIAILDGPNKGEEAGDVLVFPKVLQSQLAKSIGQTVVGRLGQGNAKPGQKPPWLLLAPNDKDIAIAQKYVARKATQVVTAVEEEEPF